MPVEPCEPLRQAIVAERERIITAMVELRDRTLDMSVADARQFVTGFVHLVDEAA